MGNPFFQIVKNVEVQAGVEQSGYVQFLRANIVILPLLAFDATGARLGRGGGHYDRTLASLRKKCHVRAIGLAFDEQMVEKCPVEPHDAPLDMVVTPMRAIRCGEGERL